jgi:hypothetical protein
VSNSRSPALRVKPLTDAPSRIVDGDSLHAGVFRGAIVDPNLPTPGGSWRLKHWQYTSLLTETHFVAFAVAQLGYVANWFAYVVELGSGRMWQSQALAPLGHGLVMAPSSVRGQTIWRRRGDRLSVAHREDAFELDLDCGIEGRRLRGQARVSLGQGLAMVHPLTQETARKNRKVAYTHKDAAMPAELSLTWGGTALPSTGLATLDWTCAVALRHTSWNWASLAHRLPDGRRVGLNLSAKVYLDDAGRQLENAVWLDGRLHLLGNVSFALPREPAVEPWRIHGDDLDLRFVPLGARHEHVHLGLVRSDFVQPFGRFSGWLQVPGGDRLTLDQSFGVVEDHDALW